MSDLEGSIPQVWEARNSLTRDELVAAADMSLDFVTAEMSLMQEEGPLSDFARAELTRARWYMAKAELILEVGRPKVNDLHRIKMSEPLPPGIHIRQNSPTDVVTDIKPSGMGPVVSNIDFNAGYVGPQHYVVDHRQRRMQSGGDCT